MGLISVLPQAFINLATFSRVSHFHLIRAQSQPDPQPVSVTLCIHLLPIYSSSSLNEFQIQEQAPWFKSASSCWSLKLPRGAMLDSSTPILALLLTKIQRSMQICIWGLCELSTLLNILKQCWNCSCSMKLCSHFQRIQQQLLRKDLQSQQERKLPPIF